MPSVIEELITSRLAELRQQLLTEYNTELVREVEEHSRQLMLEVVGLRAENDQLREQLALPARPPCTVEHKEKVPLPVPDVADSKPTAFPPTEPRQLAVASPLSEPPGLVMEVQSKETEEDSDDDFNDDIRSEYSRVQVQRITSLRSVEGRMTHARMSGGGKLNMQETGARAGLFEQLSGRRDSASSRQRKARATLIGLMQSHDLTAVPSREKLDPLGENFMSAMPSNASSRKAAGHRYQTPFGQPRSAQASRQGTGELSESGTARSRVHPAARVHHRKKPSILSMSNSEEGPASDLRSEKSAAATTTLVSDEDRKEIELDRKSNASSCTMGSSPISEDGFFFFVWPIWTEKEKLLWANSCKSSRMFHTRASGDMQEPDDDSESDNQEDLEVVKQKTVSTNGCIRCLQHITLLPSSPVRIMWDMLGCLMIGYDFVVVPLQFFDPPTTLFLAIMSWIVRFYWTFDFPLSFLTGYNRPEGRVEMRNWQIVQRYCCTWLFFDILILSFDWIEVIVGEAGGLGAARIGKMLKSMRLLRMVRLVRLMRVARMPDFLHSIAFHFQSERLQIIAGILRIVIFLVGLLHFIACCWYGIGIDVEEDAKSWVRHMDLDKAVLGYQYVTSFHWSLTQFTGTVDINPHNTGERVFAVVVLLFGFLISASVVSSITSSMTRLQIVSARQATQTSMLNQYLFDNGISTKVALRVQRNAMYALLQEKKNTPESAIELLNLVSEPLRVELHYEIHLPVLAWHPFFRRFNEFNANATRRICHVAVSRLSICRGDILFSIGEQPQFPAMYFIMNGRMQYSSDGRSPEALTPDNKWASEPVLWTPWVHLGTLRARAECMLTLLDANQFQSICVQFRTQEFFPRLYAEEFVAELNNTSKDEITDMYPGFDVEKIATKIFPSDNQDD